MRQFLYRFLIFIFSFNLANLSAQKVTVYWRGFENEGPVNEKSEEAFKNIFTNGNGAFAQKYDEDADKVITLGPNDGFESFKSSMDDIKGEAFVDKVKASKTPVLHFVFVLDTHGNKGNFSIKNGKEEVEYKEFFDLVFTTFSDVYNKLKKAKIDKRIRLSFFLETCYSGSSLKMLNAVLDEYMSERTKYKDIFYVDLLASADENRVSLGSDVASPFIKLLQYIGENSLLNRPKNKGAWLTKIAQKVWKQLDGLNTHIYFFSTPNNSSISTPDDTVILSTYGTGTDGLYLLRRTSEPNSLMDIYKEVYGILGKNLSYNNYIAPLVDYKNYLVSVYDLDDDKVRLKLYVLDMLERSKKDLLDFYQAEPDKFIYLSKLIGLIFGQLKRSTFLTSFSYKSYMPDVFSSFIVWINDVVSIIDPNKYSGLLLSLLDATDIDFKIVKTEGKSSYKYDVENSTAGNLILKLFNYYVEYNDITTDNDIITNKDKEQFYSWLITILSDATGDPSLDRIKILMRNYNGVKRTKEDKVSYLLFNFLDKLVSLSSTSKQSNDVATTMYRHMLLSYPVVTIQDYVQYFSESPDKIYLLLENSLKKFIYGADKPFSMDDMKTILITIEFTAFYDKHVTIINKRLADICKEAGRYDLYTIFYFFYDGISSDILDKMEEAWLEDNIKKLNNNGKIDYSSLVGILLANGKVNEVLSAYASKLKFMIADHEVKDHNVIKNILKQMLNREFNRAFRHEGAIRENSIPNLYLFANNLDRLGDLKADFSKLVANYIDLYNHGNIIAPELVKFLEFIYDSDNVIIDYKRLEILRAKLNKPADVSYVKKIAESVRLGCLGLI